MEGQLWKWTNYWNGWQSRWFILDQGILSYYKSVEEVEQGCKGSINVSACEISPHPGDCTRLDLSIPGEQHIYLRAKTEKERQEWLVALGSSKACLSNRKSSVVRTSASSVSESPLSAKLAESGSNSDALRSKRSELRLYCDMLTQQVHQVKETAVKAESNGGGDERISAKLDDISTLSQTCDAFISTLDELMALTDAGLAKSAANPVQNGISRIHQRSSSSASQAAGKSIPSATTLANHRQRRQKQQQQQERQKKQQLKDKNPNGFQSVFGANSYSSPDGTSPNSPEKSNGDRRKTPTSDIRIFAASNKFPNEEGAEIPTAEFLASSSEFVNGFFELLGEKEFSPIKTDARGHIDALRTKLNSDRVAFSTLDAIIGREIAEKRAKAANSASLSLVRLVRDLMFAHNFLRKFSETSAADELATQKCLTEAYEETLLERHGLVVRSVFSVAIKSSPSRSRFLARLMTEEDDSEEDLEVCFQAKIVPALAEYLQPMEACLTGLAALLNGAQLMNVS